MLIACLHTVASNVAVFEAAHRALGLDNVALRHVVRVDLLAAAERVGGLTPAIAAQTVAALHALCAGADAVLLTCSTLGPSAGDAELSASAPVVRVDNALARAAVQGGGAVVVLCAAATPLEPTRNLFEDAARTTGARVEVRLVPGAWDAFKAGESDRYFTTIADAADHAFRDGAGTVALAQSSMAGAAPLCRLGLPLSSPTAGLRAAIAAANACG